MESVIETRSLESRLAIAVDHAHLFLCIVRDQQPQFYAESAEVLKTELCIVLDEAGAAGLLPDDPLE